jgi:hypothetical protein
MSSFPTDGRAALSALISLASGLSLLLLRPARR